VLHWRSTDSPLPSTYAAANWTAEPRKIGLTSHARGRTSGAGCMPTWGSARPAPDPEQKNPKSRMLTVPFIGKEVKHGPCSTDSARVLHELCTGVHTLFLPGTENRQTPRIPSGGPILWTKQPWYRPIHASTVPVPRQYKPTYMTCFPQLQAEDGS
jgi:hypothetical protein